MAGLLGDGRILYVDEHVIFSPRAMGRDIAATALSIALVANCRCRVQKTAMLSQRTRYTIRAMLYLADQYGAGPVRLTRIAEAQNIPPKFLTVMLSNMRRQGLVETMRGRDGGYWLARPPSEISYGDLVRLTRGSLGLLPCASRRAYKKCNHCIDENSCRLRRVMLKVRDETAHILDGLSLADPIPATLLLEPQR